MAVDRATIGLQIQRLRESIGLSQKELAERAQLDASIISRLEAGKYKKPREQTITKLEYALGLTVGSLSGHSSTPFRMSGPTEVHFAFPHTTTPSPLIRLAITGEVPRVSFSSFALASTPGKPHWLPTNAQGNSLPDTNHENIQPFYSVTLKELLDRREADVVLAYSGIFESYHEMYRRFAQVSAGLSSLTCCRILPNPDKYSSTRNQKESPVISPRGLEDLVARYLKRDDLATVGDHQVIDFAKWQEALMLAKGILDSSHQLTLFLWEPYMTWIKNTLGKDNYEFKDQPLLGIGTDINEIPIFSTMDIIIRADDPTMLQWLTEERKKSDGFFSRLKASIRQMKAALKTEGVDLEPLPTIAKYLGMSEGDVRAQLVRQDFDVRYYD